MSGAAGGTAGAGSPPAGGNSGAKPPGAGAGAPPAGPRFPKGAGVGDTIQTIEGRDLDGEDFSLDDYTGKVMMIDFWGDW